MNADQVKDSTPEVPETLVEEEESQEPQTHAGSHKITNFFPVLKTEGRAKMCSSKSGDAKQKEVLQKYISTPNLTKVKEPTSTQSESQTKASQSRSGMKLSSALKTPLSQVLRKNIGSAESKSDEKANTASNEAYDTTSVKKNLRSCPEIFKGKAKKSFSSYSNTAQIKKLPLSGTSHSAKSFPSTSTNQSTDISMPDPCPEEKEMEKSNNQKPSVAEEKSNESIPEDKITTDISSVKNLSPNSTDSTPKALMVADDFTKIQGKMKKNKKRHFRGGTYGLYLTPARKRKKNKKSSPDSGSKDDECSLAGTENSSYIDSDDGNSLVSDDLNTPSEKSLADEEPSLDSRNSPMLHSAESKNSSIGTRLVSKKQQGKNQIVDVNDTSRLNTPEKQEFDNSAVKSSDSPILESLGGMQWEDTTTSGLSAPKNEFGEMLKAPQYDDISNESFSNSNSFTFNKESLLEGMDDTEIQGNLFEDNEKSIDNEIVPDEAEDVADSNQEISMLLDELNSCATEKKDTDNENEVLTQETSLGIGVTNHSSSSKDVPNEEKVVSNQDENDLLFNEQNVSGEVIEQNTSNEITDMMPNSSKNYNESELHSDEYKEDNDALSTIATSVKSRQRIKRRFTDDVVDTEIGLLSINSIYGPRKTASKPDPPPPPTDILESFVPATTREASMGPTTKLEFIYSNRQPLIAACTCKEDTYKANLKKEKQAVYCQAVDSIDDKYVGCCNPVVTSSLVRPSVKIPFTVMCEMHLWRLSHHHSCPYCGLFCSQGSFMQCSTEDKKNIHLFHGHCQIKEEGHIPFCLHCGETSRLKVVELEMNMTSPPTFYLNQHSNDPVAKARITFASSVSNKDKEFDMTSDKIHMIAESGKILSSVGLPNGPDQAELDEMIKILNSNKPVPETYSLDDFYVAASKGDVSKILDMLSLGFDPNNKFAEHEYDTALHAASSENHLTVLHLLIQAGAINDSLNERIYTPLMVATEKGYKAIAHYLVRKGSLTDFRGESGMTSIHIAAKSGNLELLSILMGSRKIDVNAQDDGGWTAIVWASEHNHYDVVRYLLERGANPNIKDNEGNTGLHWSAFSGSSEICFLYLDFGCEIDAVNEHGDTPLHIAARQDKIACVTLFLSRGANVQIKNKANMLAAECCLDKNSQTYLQLSLNLLLKKITGKYNHKAEKILHRDISRGKEQIAIQCVNAVDEEPPPFNFLYVTENCETMPINIDRTITSLQSCHCEDDCTTTNCTCAQISFRCWYDKEGCLQPDFNMLDPPMLFECNRACSCWSLNCRNRTLQNGITSRLQLVRTKGKGWGVRTLKDIPKGAFICEYVGELISDSEADKREDDSYLFDLDNRDGETYCLDARYYGNISRFINHLCEPNLVPVKIFVDHQDLSFPRIAFFSSREIKQYEELGFDYGEKFWSIKYKWFTCDCGTPKCKYSKDTIHETLANYYRRLKEEQLEETAHIQAAGIAPY